jgi:membrane-bound metal-dependent hydrolase YbcI (DUF457 family)
MPGYKNHLAGGVVAYGLTVYLLRSFNPTIPTLVEWLVCALAGSLFPDIDTKSKGQKYFYSLLFVVCIALVIFKRFKIIALLACLCMIPLLVNHRGLLHRAWFLIGLPVALAFIGCQWMPTCADAFACNALFFIVGALSHVWLDVGIVRMFRW